MSATESRAETERVRHAKISERKPQRQDSLTAQLHDLIQIANREGMYDAADWVEARISAAHGAYPSLPPRPKETRP